MAHDDQNGSFEHKVGPPASYCPNKNSRKLGFIRHHFEKISVSTLWTFFQVQRPAANAANTFSGARKKWRCVSTALTLLQVHCPDSAPSLRGLNTKAPLSPSIRRTFCPQITLLRRQVYGELNLVRKGIFGCNLHFFLPSDVPSLSPLLLNIIALGIKLSMEKAVSFKWPQYFVHTFNFCQTLLYSKMLIKDFFENMTHWYHIFHLYSISVFNFNFFYFICHLHTCSLVIQQTQRLKLTIQNSRKAGQRPMPTSKVVWKNTWRQILSENYFRQILSGNYHLWIGRARIIFGPISSKLKFQPTAATAEAAVTKKSKVEPNCN